MVMEADLIVLKMTEIGGAVADKALTIEEEEVVMEEVCICEVETYGEGHVSQRNIGIDHSMSDVICLAKALY